MGNGAHDSDDEGPLEASSMEEVSDIFLGFNPCKRLYSSNCN
jgi:hypothetical protein